MASNISVVIVHYHSGEMTANAVTSISREIPSVPGHVDVLVIDNGSSLGERTMMSTLPLRRIDAGGNLGYGGGANLGAAQGDSDFIFFMNPDVEPFPGCLSALVEELETGADAVGPQFFWDRQRRFFLPPTEKRSRGSELRRRLAGKGGKAAFRARRSWRRHAAAHRGGGKTVSTPWLSGALLGVRRDAWQAVGSFDERYRLYFEETDWLLRLKRSGRKSFLVPSAAALHFYNQSAGREPAAGEWFAQSSRIFERRWYGRWFSILLSRMPMPEQPVSAPVPSLLPSPPMFELPLQEVGREYPFFIEISPSPLGFPAAVEPIGQGAPPRWIMPADAWDYLAPGQYYLRLVDGSGKELSLCRFEKPPL